MDKAGGSRQVTHLSQYFVRRSEAWLYDVVTLPGSFDPHVICESRQLPDEFPFGEVRVELPSSKRFGAEWCTRQLNKRTPLHTKPHNYWKRSIKKLFPLDSDVFHAHFGPTGWMAVDAGLSPLVTSFYGYDATVRSLLSYWGLRYDELFANGTLFVVEGPAMARKLIGLGAPAERVRVLPLIAEVETLRWRPPELLAPVRLLMAGRFVEKKGFLLGIEAFAAVAAKTEAHLTLMGGGPTEAVLVAAVHRLGIADHVTFVPFGGRDVYREHLAATDVLLQPSLTAPDGDSEGGAPTVLLDAQAVGAVIVASDHADIPFVVNPQAAYLFGEGDPVELAAALTLALRTRDEWRDRSAAGRQHVEAQHGRESVARCRDDIYAEAAESHP